MSVLFRSQVEMLAEPKQGTVVQAIAPNQRGRVQAMGSYWPAELYLRDRPVHLLPEQPIVVVAMRNITLLVIPVSQ